MSKTRFQGLRVISYLVGAVFVEAPSAVAVDVRLPPIETDRAVLVHTVPGVKNGNHVQGLCVDDDAIYISQMIQLTKFDWNGKFVKKVAVPSHTGDVCIHNGRLYAAVSYWGAANKDGYKGGIYEYDTDLNFIRKVEFAQELDGICVIDGVIYAGYGPNPMECHLTNRFVRVDLRTLRTIDIKEVCYGKRTNFGCQNATTADNTLYAIFYNHEHPLVNLDRNLNVIGIPDASAFHHSAGEGFSHVPRKHANGADNIFMRLRTMNRFVKDRDREPIYAVIDFFAHDRAKNRMVNATLRK